MVHNPIKLIKYHGTERTMAFFIPLLQFHKGRRASLKHTCATICISFSNMSQLLLKDSDPLCMSLGRTESLEASVIVSNNFSTSPRPCTSFHNLAFFFYLVLSKHEYRLHLICYHFPFLDVHIWLTNPKREKKKKSQDLQSRIFWQSLLNV